MYHRPPIGLKKLRALYHPCWAPLTKQTPRSPTRRNNFNISPKSHYDVTDHDVQQFWKTGYFTSPVRLLQPTSVDLLRRAMYDVYDGKITTRSSPYEYEHWKSSVEKYNADGNVNVLKINNAWWVNSTLQTFLVSPEVQLGIAKIARRLLRAKEVRLFHDQAICKPPSCGTSQGNIGWHQDYGYWQISSSPLMITALIMLQDTNLSNGCLETMAGSHRLGLIETVTKDPGFFTPDRSATLSHLAKKKPKMSLVQNEVIAGQVTFHHSLTFHGSGPNHSDKLRWAYAMHMHSEKCRVALGKGYHHNLRDVGPSVTSGTKFDGAAFPKLSP